MKIFLGTVFLALLFHKVGFSNEIDVKKTVEICQKYKCPIIPFGVGSSLEGHVNAL